MMGALRCQNVPMCQKRNITLLLCCEVHRCPDQVVSHRALLVQQIIKETNKWMKPGSPSNEAQTETKQVLAVFVSICTKSCHCLPIWEEIC